MTSEVTKAKKNRPSRYRPEFDKVEAIADAVIESDRMDCTARYLVTGRRFANLETEEIKQRWTEATRNFLISYGIVNPREMDDLGSELASERWHCLWKMLVTKPRQLRGGSGMTTTPKLAREYETESVAFGMTSKSDEIEGSRGPQDGRS
jgi:hypothetical protein